MKSIFITALACVIGFTSCHKNSTSLVDKSAGRPSSDTTTPTCILNIIADIQSRPLYNPPATVYEFNYHNQRVFAVSSNCCDQFNTLYDTACNVLCAPSGGITGQGDGACPDFLQNATGQRLIWADPR